MRKCSQSNDKLTKKICAIFIATAFISFEVHEAKIIRVFSVQMATG